MDIGETEVAPLVTVGEPLMVNAELVEDGRLQVMHVHGIFSNVHTLVVGLAVCDATTNAAPG